MNRHDPRRWRLPAALVREPGGPLLEGAAVLSEWPGAPAVLLWQTVPFTARTCILPTNPLMDQTITEQRTHEDWWESARARVDVLPEERRRERVAALIAHVESAWAQVRSLERLCKATPADDSAAAQFLYFIRTDVIDLFRTVAVETAGLVREDRDADPDSLDGEADRFGRYVLLVEMAASDPIVPPEIREPARLTARSLYGWADEFSRRLSAVVDVP